MRQASGRDTGACSEMWDFSCVSSPLCYLRDKDQAPLYSPGDPWAHLRPPVVYRLCLFCLQISEPVPPPTRPLTNNQTLPMAPALWLRASLQQTKTKEVLPAGDALPEGSVQHPSLCFRMIWPAHQAIGVLRPGPRVFIFVSPTLAPNFASGGFLEGTRL